MSRTQSHSGATLRWSTHTCARPEAPDVTARERTRIYGAASISRIGGALSAFWAGGGGASHASISTAFALAGHAEPLENESLNKERRVLRALRSSTGEPFMRLVEELVALIRGTLEDNGSPKKGRTLRAAFGRSDSSLSPEGFVVWDSRLTPSSERVPVSSQPKSPPANSLDLKIRNIRRIVDQIELCDAPVTSLG